MPYTSFVTFQEIFIKSVDRLLVDRMVLACFPLKNYGIVNRDYCTSDDVALQPTFSIPSFVLLLLYIRAFGVIAS